MDNLAAVFVVLGLPVAVVAQDFRVFFLYVCCCCCIPFFEEKECEK